MNVEHELLTKVPQKDLMNTVKVLHVFYSGLFYNRYLSIYIYKGEILSVCLSVCPSVCLSRC